MPKSLTIDPAEARQRAVIHAPEIPVNAYVSDPAAEAARYSRAELVNIYHDMLLIREFETALGQLQEARCLSRHPLQSRRTRSLVNWARSRCRWTVPAA